MPIRSITTTSLAVMLGLVGCPLGSHPGGPPRTGGLPVKQYPHGAGAILHGAGLGTPVADVHLNPQVFRQQRAERSLGSDADLRRTRGLTTAERAQRSLPRSGQCPRGRYASPIERQGSGGVADPEEGSEP